MSKIGSKTIKIPATVKVNISEGLIKISGREGELNFGIPHVLELLQKDDALTVKAKNEEKKTKSLHGFFRQVLFNAIKGVETLWTKKLEVVGTGYNVKLQGEDLVLRLGYSHPVVFKKTDKINYKVDGNNKINVSGVDKQLVGQIAYQIKILKRPDKYKGKGIRHLGETIKLKPGKKVKTTTTAS